MPITPLKQLFFIMIHDKKEDPFRVLKKSYARYKKHGWLGMLQRLEKEYEKIAPSFNSLLPSLEYERWISLHEKNIDKTLPLAYKPLVSIICPVYNVAGKYLTEMIESILAQTYSNIELCIADDASTNLETLQVLKSYEHHEKIKIIFRKENGHICEASNAALLLAKGDYVAFVDHDDMLTPHAIYEMVKKLNENRDLKIIYSDEDKIDENSKRFLPHFKSGWNKDLLFSQNYITHLLFVKRELVVKIGGFRKGYEGSQDYDLLLRCLHEIKESQIDRVEKVLYHWRAIEGSTAYSSNEKNYTHKAGKKALQDYFNTKKIDAIVEDGLLPNTYKVNYLLPKKLPLVSLIIPTKNRYDILKKCIESILEKTLYANYEIIILDNESTCPKTLEYFKKVSQIPNVTVLPYHHPFNYSALCNYGVLQAKGELIGLINNDIEIINKEWLNEMVQHALRPEIGAVGAKLYYENDTIQHAGVVLGIGGVAGHAHKYFKKEDHGYFSRLKLIQNYSAVTGACLVVQKKLYEEVGGLDEKNLKVAFNDVDFCLKLLERGYKNLWTPYAKAYHHESLSRGSEDTQEKKKRFAQEVYYMKNRWKRFLYADLYYNSNLTKLHENFRIKIDE